jgi:CBS domain containing-hemolysin-like protein
LSKRSQFLSMYTFTLVLFTLVAFTCGNTAYAIGAAPDTATGLTSTGTIEATSTDVVLLIAYILLALIFSFLCSVAEAVLLSITPSYIAGLRETNPNRASLLRKLKHDNVDQSLAAILTLNTIAHTVGAIGSGAKATLVFGSAWFGLFSAVMTLLILFLSEIIPKTIGAVFWRKLVGPTATFIRSLIVILYPLIWVSEALTKVISGGKKAHVFNREEFIAMASVGQRAGEIDDTESRIIQNLFHLKALKTKDIMTPRTVIMGMQQDQSVKQVLDAQPPYSRLPVYSSDLDNITGFVMKDDILLTLAQSKSETQLHTLKRELLAVPDEMPLAQLLEFFLNQRQQVALVVNEYGGTAGLVSLEDLIETLLGIEIVDETDRVEDLQALARQQWTKRAKELGIELHDDEQEVNKNEVDAS